MDGSKISTAVVACGAAIIMILAMTIIVAKYLFDTFSGTGVLVAILATAVVVTTAGIPYLVQRRRCARQEAARIASRTG